MKTTKLFLPTLIIITILSSCGGEENAATDGSENKKEEVNAEFVGTQKMERTDFQNFFEIQGTTEAEKMVMVNSESSGLIKKIIVEEGQKVTAGQTIMILDAAIIAQNIDEVKKSLELAEFVYEKQKNLHDQGIGSELQYQQAKNNKERLEETLATLKTQQGKSVVTAPFSGVIDEIFVYEGEMAMPQIPLARILDLSKIKITADVMETYLKDVKPGTKVDISFMSLDTTIENLSLSRIGKFVNPGNRSFVIESKLINQNERILPNLVASVKVKHEIQKNVFVVPSMALLQSSSGQNYIYVIEEKMNKEKKKVLVAKKLIVKRGATDQVRKITVIEDMPGDNNLVEGLKLIVDGARGVKPGMEVRER